MNYQKIASLESQYEKAAKILEYDASMIEYYAWPQTFSSTAGPFGGFAGQAVSTFTVEAFTDGRDAVLFCGGKYWKRVEKFNPSEAVRGDYR